MKKEYDSYNPAPFVLSNIKEFMPGSKLEEISVDFSGFFRKPFQSGKRPVGTIVINSRNNNGQSSDKCFFLKYHNQASLAFENMQYVYSRLLEKDLQNNMPQPLICDIENGIIYQEFVKGTGLKYDVILRLFANSGRKIDKASELFYRIGSWLAGYHKAMESNERVNLGQYIHEVIPLIIEDEILFSEKEKERLSGELNNLQSDYGHYPMILTRPHNDFSLRNILLTNDNDFKVVDWDAMIHKDFPETAPSWNDITCFCLNTLSLIRFFPFARQINIKKLFHSFLRGYFNQHTEIRKTEIQKFLWFFSLAYYTGLIGDRPLYQIYKTRLSRRFIRNMHLSLVSGKVTG